jgi:hypothetical protein
MEENYNQPKTPLKRPVRTFSQPQPAKKERIKVWMGALIILTALSIDIFQGILNPLAIGAVLGPIISVCADLVFIIWFWILGIGFIKNPKNFAAMGIQALVGLVPILNTVPELTLGITAIVFMTIAEDKGGIIGEVAGMAQGKVKQNV